MERQIIIYENYFLEFFEAQEQKVKEKIGYVLDLIRFEQRVPKKFLKHLEGTDGIYEIRVITTNKNIRIFCFFDQGKLVVLTNCFIKKTQKTPKKELKLAEKLKTEYFDDKKIRNEK